MAKGYLVAVRHAMHDPDAMERYREAAVPTMPAGIRPLALYGNFELKEGSPVDGVAIIEFPTYQSAKDHYDSEGYANARKLREGAADYHVILVEGME